MHTSIDCVVQSNVFLKFCSQYVLYFQALNWVNQACLADSQCCFHPFLAYLYDNLIQSQNTDNERPAILGEQFRYMNLCIQNNKMLKIEQPENKTCFSDFFLSSFFFFFALSEIQPTVSRNVCNNPKTLHFLQSVGPNGGCSRVVTLFTLFQLSQAIYSSNIEIYSSPVKAIISVAYH